MGFISDIDSLRLAKRHLPAEDYARFVEVTTLMRHFDECVATNTPSPLCAYDDLDENLKWCRHAVHCWAVEFEHYLGGLLVIQDTINTITGE